MSLDSAKGLSLPPASMGKCPWWLGSEPRESDHSTLYPTLTFRGQLCPAVVVHLDGVRLKTQGCGNTGTDGMGGGGQGVKVKGLGPGSRTGTGRAVRAVSVWGSVEGPQGKTPVPSMCGLIPLLPTCQRYHRVGTRAQRAPGPAGVGWGGGSGPGPSLQPGLTLGVLAAVCILAGILQRLLQRRLRLLVLALQLGAEGQLQQDQVVHHDAAIPEGSTALESAPTRGTWVLGGALQKQPKVPQKRERGQRS